MKIFPDEMLFRAALTVEEIPKPRYCEDTCKTGVYFALNHPFLSETMTIEYDTDLVVAVYKVVKPIKLYVGKYAREYGPHFDPEVIPVARCGVTMDLDGLSTGEVFLTENELSRIKFVGYYPCTQFGTRCRYSCFE